jgi:Ca2+-binding EF-hand superfamily protein
MGNRTSLKLAFTIYDKNRNGVLDEDDLLQMISLSRTFTFVEADIVMIARAMSNKNKNLASSPQSSERTEKQSVASLADSGLSKKSKERNR